MSKSVVVAVFDSAVQAYGRPLFVPTNGAALRSFIDEVNRKADDNQLCRHPDDFELRVLAIFDEESGIFQAPEQGVGSVLARGKDCVKE